MAGNSTKRYFGFERTFAALVIVLLLMNLPFFLGYVLPQNDSLNSFHLFYFSYNEYFVNGEFPRWIPFGFYGFQSDLYALLTAPDCFAAIVGRLLGITNVFTMYKFVVFLDQFILLTGAYLLSKRLFKHRTTVIFVCITIILSQVFYYQIYFNMRTYEWLPLLFFLVLRFYDTMRFKYIASMMIVFIMVIIGIGPYHAPVILLPVLIFFFFLLFKNYKKLKDILPLSKNDLAVTTVLMIFFAVLTGALLIYLKLSLESSYSHNIGRDPKTLTTTLEVFLTYASYTIGFKKFIGLIYPGRLYIISGITIHIGFIALAFVAYAVIFVRRIEFYAFLFIIVIFTLFSLGKITPVAEFLYHYFPTMKYFRHIGHTVAHFKIFLPFMAAFGIDHLLSRESF